MKIIVFDTETTGVDVSKDEIIQLAVQEDLLEPKNKRVWFFKPTIPIPKEASDVHGLTIDKLTDKPTFKESIEEFLSIFESADVLVGYNLQFDIDILLNQCERLGIQLDFGKKFLLDGYRLWMACEPRDLQSAHLKFVGEEFDGAHDALADVEATSSVIVQMIGAFGLQDKTAEELNALCFPEKKECFGLSKHFKRSTELGAVFTFGKCKGRGLYEVKQTDPQYLDWIMGGQFPRDTKRVVECARISESYEVFTQNLSRTFQ